MIDFLFAWKPTRQILKFIYLELVLRGYAREQGVSYGWLKTTESIKLDRLENKRGH
jgi:hypothetical protein